MLKIQEIQTKSILSKTNLPIGDYSANPYTGCTFACKYCYACFMKRFSNHPEVWGEFLDVKYWQPLKNTQKYANKELFIGSVTDPYNPQERTYQRTKALLEELKDSGIKLSIATKSDLILRDLELIKSFKNPRVSFSINTLDENFRRDMDRAVPIKRRLEAMRILYNEGITTTCFISPIFPQITDIEAIINEAQSYCHFIWLENLNLRGSYKPVIMEYIRTKYPKLLPLYQEIYTQGKKNYWQWLDSKLKAFAESKGLEYVYNDDTLTPRSKPIIVNYFYHELIKKNAKVI
ncbi:radical SAM protein [Helicobacter brantae]|uniref:Radical SAM protein n=1 Tax=Helicobacter brantae TaxID=375927 RepID=A0A3D8J4R0_9HELI|nr:radical SAM protein [Helicobacter brantae]RDU72206.1 radical SAM protein [Helicobacter brantae]